MDIRFLIEQLDEISRRGVLKGLGAAVVGYQGAKYLDPKKDVPKEHHKLFDIELGDTTQQVLQKMNKKPDSAIKSGYDNKEEHWTYFDIGSIKFLDGKVNYVLYNGKPLISDNDAAKEFYKKQKADQLRTGPYKIKIGDSYTDVIEILGPPEPAPYSSSYTNRYGTRDTLVWKRDFMDHIIVYLENGRVTGIQR